MRNDQSKAYLIGAGIGSLAAAAFLIRDGDMRGANIRILEAGPLPGGSLDAAGDAGNGYSMRGGRMFTTDNYECTWALFKTIPSLGNRAVSVYEETLSFNDAVKSYSRARLVDKRRAKVPVTSMGFSMRDREELLKLTLIDETALSGGRITDWLSPGFFETNFWYMWSTTFAFQPWHSAAEFRRYLHRFMLEFGRIETLGGVKRTVYNQYDSLVRPLLAWLAEQGVRIQTHCEVVALEHEYRSGRFVVTGMTCRTPEGDEQVAVADDDLVFLQNGSMTDDSSIGTMTRAPEKFDKAHTNGWRLWEGLADGRPEFGNPRAFNDSIAQSCWESFTVTLKNARFFEALTRFTDNDPGTGGLVTFKDSAWLMSIVLPHQPHFLDQPPDVQVFWGYGLFPGRVGNFIGRPMDACDGADILQELRGHLCLDPELTDGAICLPCRMPYITSMFMPRAPGDRPLPVPQGSKNLALVSQFVEIPGDVVFTVEYSVRAAQMAVYALLDLDLPIPAVTPHDKSFRTRFETLLKAFD